MRDFGTLRWAWMDIPRGASFCLYDVLLWLAATWPDWKLEPVNHVGNIGTLPTPQTRYNLALRPTRFTEFSRTFKTSSRGNHQSSSILLFVQTPRIKPSTSSAHDGNRSLFNHREIHFISFSLLPKILYLNLILILSNNNENNNKKNNNTRPDQQCQPLMYQHKMGGDDGKPWSMMDEDESHNSDPTSFHFIDFLVGWLDKSYYPKYKS